MTNPADLLRIEPQRYQPDLARVGGRRRCRAGHRQGGHTAWESFDGTLLYYDGGGGLYSRAVIGGAEQEVLPPASGMGRNFFPAARGIYYAIKPDAGRPNAYEIRFLDFATGGSEILYRFESLGLSQGLSVSPDGKTIIYSGVSPSKNADLMLIQNFR